MALQLYRYVPGTLVIIGKQPDGDSVRFRPDDADSLSDIYRAHLLRPAKDGTHQLRLEGIDAPETHYGGKAQPLGKTVRDYFLRDELGFSSVTWQGESVASAEPETLRGAILTASADVHGRPISYLLPEQNPFGGADTGAISQEVLKASFNFQLLAGGHVYPLLYSSAPVEQRQWLTASAQEARSAELGIWAVDSTPRFALDTLADVGWASRSDVDASEESGKGQARLIFPKIFRRAVDFLASGEADLVTWLTQNGGENDLVIVGNRLEVPLSQLIHRENDRYRLEIDVTEAVFVEK
ncbi:thermonuclease family protein [Rhizobium paknamense]|uniref:Endonuclease YncB(Thermonuclease family) n=1 Tax=Rhizobium paknamense TaxID=1206817 RepID=A0ABU0IAE9_9HYPH|nr:hypothetical protein [Rhizobium paknamense]MDQ0455206.1 endonuclease YncB(thermonuclease family) [Rhizobium paknamense]